MRREFFQLSLDIIGAEIDPTDDAFDERIPVRQSEQKAILFQRLSRLHRDATVEARRSQFRLQIRRRETPPNARQLVRNPRVLRRIVFPEMLVRIDSHSLNVTMALMTPVSGFT
jgi:hypothetical protein